MSNRNLDKLSVAQQYLSQLSDQQIMQLVEIAQRESARELSRNQRKFILPREAKERLAELEQQPKQLTDGRMTQWMKYVKKLGSLTYTAPSFDTTMDERQLYHQLRQLCTQHYLPPDFTSAMVPTIMKYLKTDVMRPIILSGPPGCGKTTGAKILFDMIGLHWCLISTNRVQRSHGLFGEGMSYQSPDVGAFVQGMLRKETLNPAFIIDEIEKCADRGTQCSVDDELLSVCDGSAEEFEDNFLGFQISMQHCPIIMTCNELELVSEPLRDRCTVYQFHDVELSRLLPMMQDYASSQVESKYTHQVIIPSEYVEEAVSKLYRQGVHSIRQHQKLIDGTLGQAYDSYLQTENTESVVVTPMWFDTQISALSADNQRMKKIGF